MRPLRFLGLIGALLMAFAGFARPADVHASVPAPVTAATATATVLADSCLSDGCNDCGVACTHGCCQATPSAILTQSPILTRSEASLVAAAWTHVRAAALTGPLLLERPPRA